MIALSKKQTNEGNVLNKKDARKDIIEYLTNPLKHGVFTQTLSFSIYTVDSLVKKWQPKIEKEYGSYHGMTPTYTFDFKEFVDYEYWVDFKTSLHNLNNIIRFINMQKRLEKKEHPIRNWAKMLIWAPWQYTDKEDVKIENFPEYASLIEINDAINISKKGRDKKVLLNITCVGKRGIERFDEFVKSIPEIGNQADFSDVQKRHLQRFVYQPYPSALFLWINVLGYYQIPDHIRNFLNGAISYFRGKEWRTSIVLSAIAVEIVLAELFEENFHQEAPDVSLGKLIELLKEKFSFSPDIEKAISLTNEKRITAVHRSQTEPSEREAVDSLFGATRLTLWYSSRL